MGEGEKKHTLVLCGYKIIFEVMNVVGTGDVAFINSIHVCSASYVLYEFAGFVLPW